MSPSTSLLNCTSVVIGKRHRVRFRAGRRLEAGVRPIPALTEFHGRTARLRIRSFNTFAGAAFSGRDHLHGGHGAVGATSCSVWDSIMRLLRMGASWPVSSSRTLKDVVESFADRRSSRRGVLPVLQVRIGCRDGRRRRGEIFRIIRIGQQTHRISADGWRRR